MALSSFTGNFHLYVFTGMLCVTIYKVHPKVAGLLLLSIVSIYLYVFTGMLCVTTHEVHPEAVGQILHFFFYLSQCIYRHAVCYN